MTALPELHTVSRMEVAARGLCPPNIPGPTPASPPSPCWRNSCRSGFRQSLSPLWLMYSPPGGRLVGTN